MVVIPTKGFVMKMKTMEDKSLTDAVRTAIDEHIESRKMDKTFMDRLKQRHERERELYERLASGSRDDRRLEECG
jgi:hypothetical protein